MAHHNVELVAMHDEIALAVGRDVHRVAHDLDAPERQSNELARELVVIAGHEDHAGAVADLAQQLLDDVVVLLRPVPARAQTPAVNNVADEEDRVGIVVLEEIEDQRGLAAAGSQMDIGEENRAITARRFGDLRHGRL